jgi:hypothetical protein
MKTSITREGLEQLQLLKTRSDKLWEAMDRLIEKTRPLLGDDDDDPNGASADLILNSNDMTVGEWLKQNKIEVR